MKSVAGSITTFFAPGVLAGAERVVLSSLNTFAKIEGHAQVILIKESRNPQHVDQFTKLLDPKVQVEIIETSKPFDLCVVKKLKSIIKEKFKHTSIIHTHGYKALIYATLAQASKRLVHTHHGNTSHTQKVKLYERLALFCMKYCDGVVTLSRPMHNELCFIGAREVCLIPNMLSLQGEAELIKYRQSRNLGDQIKLLFLGRLSHEKGILDFLRLFNDYPNKKRYQLDIVGDGPLMNQAKNLNSNAHFHGHQNNPAAFLTEADVLVLPSLTEGMPISMMEALSLGLIVLANPVGAIPDYIQNSNLLMKVQDQDTWYKGLDEIEKKFEFYQKLAVEKASQYREQFSAKNWYQKMSVFYQRMD